MDDKALEFYQVVVRVLVTICSPMWAEKVHGGLYIPVLVVEVLVVIFVFVILGRRRWFKARWWSYPLLGAWSLGVIGSLNAIGNAILFHPD
jgi:hypothetical protein